MSNKSIQEWSSEWQAGLLTSLIDKDVAVKFVIEAAVEYQAWGFLTADSATFNQDGDFIHKKEEITNKTILTPSEWGVIKVLAYLFAEKENALIQESSRVASHEPYGRSSSEVEQDIQNFRNEHFRRQAFYFSPFTI